MNLERYNPFPIPYDEVIGEGWHEIVRGQLAHAHDFYQDQVNTAEQRATDEIDKALTLARRYQWRASGSWLGWKRTLWVSAAVTWPFCLDLIVLGVHLAVGWHLTWDRLDLATGALD